MMFSYIASAGTVCRMSAASPCNTLKRWAAFSFGIQLFWMAVASNCWWYTAQDVAPSNFDGFTCWPLDRRQSHVLFELPPLLTGPRYTPPGSRFLVLLWRWHFSVAYLASLRLLLGQHVTCLCFKLLPDYTHAIAHLVLHGMPLSNEVISLFAHVRLYFSTYITLQFPLSCI